MKQRTIEELRIEADKMSWLRFKSKDQVLSIKWWDSKDTVEVTGKIWDRELIIIPKEFINHRFKNQTETWDPIAYSRRLWSLWKPKTLGFLRFATSCWEEAVLNLCANTWEIIGELIQWIKLEDITILSIKTEYWEKMFEIFNPEKHRKKINKILDLSF